MSDGSTGVVVVYVTAPVVEAPRLARALVERKLAACVNIVPHVQSVYRWQGAIHDEPESLLIIKTTVAAFEPLASCVRELHPYSTPEIIALPVTAGYAPYLAWVREGIAP